MTITDVTLVSEDGSATGAGATYQRVYGVQFTGGYSAAALIHNAEPDLPKVGNAHPDDTAAFAATVTPKLADNDGGVAAGYATYAVEYRAKDPADDKTQAPAARQPEITWGGSDLTETVQKDAAGVPIMNSALDLYEPYQERPIRGGECQITYNVTANPADLCVAFSNSVNDAAWNGVAAGNGLIGKVTASKVYEQFEGETVSYWKLTVPIRFRRDGWRLKLIDNGFRTRGADGKAKSVVDDMGHAPAVPVLLDGHGKELAAGADPVPFPTAGYQLNDETDWSTLALPNPFA